MKIAIAGLGVVGNALYEYLTTVKQIHIEKYDPPKNMNTDLNEIDVCFICVPVMNCDQSQDLSNVHSILRALKKDCIVFLRSTVLPGTATSLMSYFPNIKYIISLPEFLTATQARDDMFKLDVIAGSPQQFNTEAEILTQSFFPSKKIFACTNVEAEITKYTHNCFAAIKVNFFNIIHEICSYTDSNYDFVKKAILLTNFINPMHTNVPGPDGHFGYGGTCLPKDMKAFLTFLEKKNENLARIFRDTISNNEIFREKIMSCQK